MPKQHVLACAIVSAHIAIIGGGFCGVALASHLAGRQRVTVVDPGPVGQGAAYRARSSALKLNVAAERMSLDPAEPNDFCDWLHRNRIEVRGFAERRHYRAYLQQHFEAAQARGVRLVKTSALELERAGTQWQVKLAGQQPSLEADAVVLATGNSLPVVPFALEGAAGVHVNPWNEESLLEITPTDRVLVVGTGLTAIDVVLVLASQGHSGPILAVSRHGRWPLPHLQGAAQAVDFALEARTARGLLRELRQQVASNPTVPWQKVMDAVRAQTAQVWGALPVTEQARFLRHLRSQWEIHRHRGAAEALNTLKSLANLTTRAARVSRVQATSQPLRVQLGTTVEEVDQVVVCTGPSWRTPLLSKAERSGLVRVDAHGLGVEPVVPGLHTVGGLRRGALWESTAVPELAKQAQELARQLA